MMISRRTRMAAMSRRQLAEEFGVCYVTVLNWSKSPSFPEPMGVVTITKGPQSQLFDVGAVRAWHTEMMAARRAARSRPRGGAD